MGGGLVPGAGEPAGQAVDVPTGQGELDGIAALGPDDVWAAGRVVTNEGGGLAISPLLLHWDGEAWSQATPPLQGDADLSAVAAIPGGGFWAVGTRGPGSPARSLVLRCS